MEKADNALKSAYQINQSQVSGGGDKVEVFKNGVYALARRDCVGCHGSAQNPKFAVNDLSAAYGTAKTLVVWNNLELSALMRKIQDGHCGPACLTRGREMLEYLTAWKDAEEASSEPQPSSNPTPSSTPSSGASPSPTPSSSQTSTPSALTAAQTAYKNSVFTIVRRDCVGCHGASQNPKFAVADVATSYTDAKYLVNFSAVANSTLIRKIKDGHCGTSVCATNGNEMTAAIETWKLAEVGNPTPTSTPTSNPGSSPSPGPTFVNLPPLTGNLACNAGEDPSPTDLRRLTREQYINAVNDTLYYASGSGNFNIRSALTTSLGMVPNDMRSKHSFGAIDNTVTAQHLEAYFIVASMIPPTINLTSLNAISDSIPASSVSGAPKKCLGQTSPTEFCITEFIKRYGLYFYSRPLEDAEVTRYKTFYASASDTASAVGKVLMAMSLAPDFLYQVEVRGTPVGGREDLLTISPYELARRVSLHYYDNLPGNTALFSKVTDGTFADPVKYEAFIKTISVSSHSKFSTFTAKIDRFYNQWFPYGSDPSWTMTTPFKSFRYASGSFINQSHHDYWDEMKSEITQMYRWITWSKPDGSMRDLLLSNLNYTGGYGQPHLASLYDPTYAFAPVGTKLGSPWGSISSIYRTTTGSAFAPGDPLPDAERVGILTRSMFLNSGDEHTNPFNRGVYIRRQILCEDLPSPDLTVLGARALEPPSISETSSNRERFTAKTADASCMGCHNKINGLGFALENFDALGRQTWVEKTFHSSIADRVIATHTINATAQPNITPDDTTTVTGGKALSQLIADSGKADQCFARQYFRFQVGRNESQGDGCLLTEARDAMVKSGGSIQELMKKFTLHPSFKLRKVGQ